MNPKKTLVYFIVIIAIASILLSIANHLYKSLPPPDKDKDPLSNVVIISIDTCRADYLGCYGSKLDTTPNIDLFAEDSVLFEKTYTPVPMTLPAHASILSGTLPPYHGVRNNFSYMADNVPLLPELLKTHDYTTAAIVSSSVLDSQFGLARGFDTYNDTFEKAIKHSKIAECTGDEVTRKAIELLDSIKDKRFFLFLHYFDPHAPYEAPAPFDNKFSDNAYAGEVAFTDHCIGKVIQHLKDLQLYDESLIIILGDHGEMLGEHGEQDHAYFVYESAVRVPLIIKPSGNTSASRFPEHVSLTDILPTVCSTLETDRPSIIHGKDLSHLLKGDTKEIIRTIYCESMTPASYGANPLYSVVNGDLKYIHHTKSPELYDVENDPDEKNNLAETDLASVKEMSARIRMILKKTKPANNLDRRKVKLTPEALRKMESLGYVSGGEGKIEYDVSAEKKDARSLIAFHVELQNAVHEFHKGELKKSASICEKLIIQQPQLSTPYKYLGDARHKLGQLEEAMNCYDKALELDKSQAGTYINRANVLSALNKHQLAVKDYTTAIQIDPRLTEPWSNRGNLRMKSGDLPGALADYNKALSIDPDNAEVLCNRAIAYQNKNELKAASQDFDRSIKLDPTIPETWYSRAHLKKIRGDKEGCIADLTKCLEVAPENWPHRAQITTLLEGMK